MAMDYTAQYRQWHKNLMGNQEVLDCLANDYGLTLDTVDHFNLGYVSDWTGPDDTQGLYRGPRLIIPYTPQFYRARRLDGRRAAETLSCGTGPKIFNAAGLTHETVQNGTAVWVLTDCMDCMLLWQRRIRGAVSIGQPDGAGPFGGDFARLAKSKNPAAEYILALDNDETGRAAQLELVRQMQAERLHFTNTDLKALYGPYTNVRGAKDDSDFWERVGEHVQAGFERRYERDNAPVQAGFERRYERDNAPVQAVRDFYELIQSRRFEPVSTGIDCIDSAIGGGLIRQQLVMLAAGPGMGKTSLASQICENMARAGYHALYFNFEMSREQLLARSIARQVKLADADGVTDYSNVSNAKTITALDILQGYKWTDNQRGLISAAVDRYIDTTARHMLYNPGPDDKTEIDAIIDTINAETYTPDIVCIDYLQLLTHDAANGDVIATIRYAMQVFKTWAIKNNAIVLIITATNRGAMRTGDSGLNSGRDTSNIEYGADLHLGLEYTAIGDGTPNPYVHDDKKQVPVDLNAVNRAKAEYFDDKNHVDKDRTDNYKSLCTRYTLKVNKGRFTPDGERALLHFDGERGLFAPADLKLDKRETLPPQETNTPALATGRRKK